VPRLEAARLSDWRARVDRAAETAHKERTRDNEIVRLQGKVGNMTVENEQLYAKIDRPDGGSP
jgi:transposase